MEHLLVDMMGLDEDNDVMKAPENFTGEGQVDIYKLTEMKDAPVPLGNFVMLSHYVDANIYHDMLMGRSVTGILHYLNKTPIDWYSKKQATIETATYGSELMSTRLAVDQIVDLRLTLKYLGVPIHEKSYLFGDHKLVVNSSAKPQSKLHK